MHLSRRSKRIAVKLCSSVSFIKTSSDQITPKTGIIKAFSMLLVNHYFLSVMLLSIYTYTVAIAKKKLYQNMVMTFHETKMHQINSFGNLIQMISALSRFVRSHTWSVTTSGNIGIIISLPLTGETCWLLDCWTIKSPCQLIDVFPKGLNHVGLICMCDKLPQL